MKSTYEDQDLTGGTDTDQVDYEAPRVDVLGTFAELTRQGTGPPDEVINDGSQI